MALLPITAPLQLERTTPCYSEDPGERLLLTDQFDSTDLIEHMDARELCSSCPFLDGCRQLAHDIAQTPAASWAKIPSGTWGGELWKNGTLVSRR